MASDRFIRNKDEAGKLQAEILLLRNLGQPIPPEKMQLLNHWFELHPESQADFEEMLRNPSAIKSDLDLYQEIVATHAGNKEKILEAVGIQIGSRERSGTRKQPIYIISGIAATLLLMLVGYMVLHESRRREVPSSTERVMADLAPGRNQATLTLANGQQVVLGNSTTGTIAMQGNLAIQRHDNTLSYDNSDSHDAALAGNNTLRTARGESFAVTLPDGGTRVFLNAGSSITYPLAFSGDYRTVTVTGEAYFEVKHNARQPFRVIAGNQVIEDVGTAFNVNSYDEENATRTTLVEGAVRVKVSQSAAVLLHPGQQASSRRDAGDVAPVLSKADLDETVGWHSDAVIAFNMAPLPAIMRALGRWYNADIEYVGKMPPDNFHIYLKRDMPVSEALSTLQYMGKMSFRIVKENNGAVKIVVTGN
jgi:transmembrane sensor